MDDRKPIGIVGAGMAGLAAAWHLSRAGRAVRVFEGRNRIGGRTFTALENGASLPIELGAEFVHGPAEPTLSLMNEVEVPAEASADRHARYGGGRFHDMGSTWARFARLLKGASEGPDRSADAFRIEQGLDGADAELFRLLIEGFEAAPLDDVSVQSIAHEAKSAAEDPSQFRPRGGYGSVIHGMERLLDPGLSRIELNATVSEVHWQPGGPCALRVRRADAIETVDVERCIVTAPIGVLSSSERAASIRFFPDVNAVSGPASLLAMGHVVKVIFRFRPVAWTKSLPDSEFFHFAEGMFPTFWHVRTDSFHQVTAWAGGPKTKQLEAFGTRDLIDQIAEELARFCGVLPTEIRDAVLSTHHHDFSRDPYSLGAYPYVRVGGSGVPVELARPVANALYFAGDATDVDHFGTVAGALASGSRVAKQILSP